MEFGRAVCGFWLISATHCETHRALCDTENIPDYVGILQIWFKRQWSGRQLLTLCVFTKLPRHLVKRFLRSVCRRTEVGRTVSSVRKLTFVVQRAITPLVLIYRDEAHVHQLRVPPKRRSAYWCGLFTSSSEKHEAGTRKSLYSVGVEPQEYKTEEVPAS